MDLHVHTPASADYQDLSATYLQIVQQAEIRGLDIVALTDHNTISGIATMRREIEDLQLLEELDRLSDAERDILAEYRRVLDRVLVLPGFEFTAAYGFHLLAIFPPTTTLRRLEYVLFTLGVFEEEMEDGSTQAANAADVLSAYEFIAEQGGLVIPAHVNEGHGIAAPGFRYGTETKAAYTQSEYVAALEVTDLDDQTRRATAMFFNGTRPDFPRRMHCIQGSDAHRVLREGAHRDTDLGIGDRATEVQLPERSFDALRDLFASEDWIRTRPYTSASLAPADTVQSARELGANTTQAFHENVRSRRSRYRPVLKDVVAFANTNGGTIYIGANANPRQPALGVPLVDEAERGLRDAVTRGIVPRLDVTVETTESGGKAILIVRIPKGPSTPYATDAGQVFVRQGGESVVALRDEIVQLVRETVVQGDMTPSEDRVWSTPRPSSDADDDNDPDADSGSRAAQSAVRPGVPPAPMPAPRPVVIPHAIMTQPASRPAPAPLVVPEPSFSSPSDMVPAPVPSIVPAVAAPVAAERLAADTALATVEAEADISTADATDEIEPTGDDTMPEDAPAERRPRRRRRRSSAQSAAAHDDDTGIKDDNNDPAVSAPLVMAEADSTAAKLPRETTTGDAPDTPAESPADDAATPKPRRRRRPSRAKTADAPTADDTAVGETIAQIQAIEILPQPTISEASDTATEFSTADAAPKPRRRRPSRAKTASVTAETSTDTASDDVHTSPTVADPPHVNSETAAPSASIDVSMPPVLPSSGVEIIAVNEQNGERQYTMHDFHTGEDVAGLTRKAAQGAWRLAIVERENGLPALETIRWNGQYGYVRTAVRGGERLHNLALRESDRIRYIYAVTDSGLTDEWRAIVPPL